MHKFGFIGLTLIGLGATAYAGGTSGEPTSSVIASIHVAVVSIWEFEGAIGNIVTQIGQAAPNLLGCLTCLVLPLAWLGAWTLTNLPRILGLMTLRDNVRSLFKD